jgi:hypothetical protein
MFRNLIALLMLMPITVFMNCKNTDVATNSSEKGENSMQEAIAFTTLLSDSQSNFNEKTQRVITTQEELNTVFAKINSTRMPGIPVPDVDFNEFEVFLYAPGEVNHGTAGPKVASVVKQEDAIVVKLAAKEPQGDFVTMVMSQPCVLIKYKKQALPVVVKTANTSKQ